MRIESVRSEIAQFRQSSVAHRGLWSISGKYIRSSRRPTRDDVDYIIITLDNFVSLASKLKPSIYLRHDWLKVYTYALILLSF